MAYRATIVGASGYAGLELLRLLSAHPEISVSMAGASTRAGEPVSRYLPNIEAYRDLEFSDLTDARNADADIVFSSLPNGKSAELFAGWDGPPVVDIGGDFRLSDPQVRGEWYPATPVAEAGWVYGLTELHRDEIRRASRVAGPGCYAAAVLLALTPLVAAGVIDPETIHIDALSGVSGAGRAGGEGFGFVEANENARPYSPVGHKHVAEIEQELARLHEGPVTVSFVPHLVPMNRGIAATCVGKLNEEVSDQQLTEVIRAHWQGEPFVRVLNDELPATSRVSGTNIAEVTARADVRTGRALAFACIDNLGKGAAGQAVQNANLMLGIEETSGLKENFTT